MGDCSVLMMGSGFGSGVGAMESRRLELSLLSVLQMEGPGVIAKSWATFGDIGDGVASPSCMTAVGGVVVCCDRCNGGGLRVFSRLYSNCLPLPLSVGGVVIVCFLGN